MDTAESDPTVFGRRVRYYRTRIGLTQDEFAEQVGITLLSVSRYETGERYPQVDVFAKMAEVLGVSVGELLDPNGPDPADRPRAMGKRK